MTRGQREDVNYGLGHVRGVVADRLIYQDAHVFSSGDVLELNNGLGYRDVLDLCDVLVRRQIHYRCRIVALVRRLFVACARAR